MRKCLYDLGAWRLDQFTWLVAACDRTLLEKVGDAFDPDHCPPENDGLPVNIAAQERVARLSCRPRCILASGVSYDQHQRPPVKCSCLPSFGFREDYVCLLPFVSAFTVLRFVLEETLLVECVRE